jgi:hypothetical protein
MKAAIDALYKAQDDAVSRHSKATATVNHTVKLVLEAQTKLIQCQDHFNSRVKMLQIDRVRQDAIERELSEIESAIVKLETE